MAFSLDKRDRLLRTADFQAVYKRNRAYKGRRFILLARPNRAGRPRLGLSVSKKVGDAVARNRWKRLFREAFRLLRPGFSAPLDFVCIPHAGQDPEAIKMEVVQRDLRALLGAAAAQLLRPSEAPPPVSR